MTNMIYSNGAYLVDGGIKGFWRWRKRLVGIVTKTAYPEVYPVGRKMNTFLYACFWDKEPKWKPAKEDSPVKGWEFLGPMATFKC